MFVPSKIIIILFNNLFYFEFFQLHSPDWKKANIWDVALENIDEMLTKYKKKMK